MPHGYSNRIQGLLSVLLIVVVGSAIVGLVLRGSTGDSASCPRTFPPTDMTAMLLLEDTSGLTGLSSEVTNVDPRSLRPLTNPGDAEACRRLRALLPDTLKVGLLAPHTTAFYRAGDLYVVPVVPNIKPSEVAAMERGEFVAEHRGTTHVYDAEFTLLASYDN
jgi:hypothetical protein